MNRLGPPLMHRLDQLLELIDFNNSIELDYLQVARCLEGMRQRCCQLDRDLQGARTQLRQSESERSVLEVKLKHARNQVEVEMKKRHLAEAELENQERKLQLIYDFLMADPQIIPLNEEQRSALTVLDRPSFRCSSLLPSKRLSAREELGNSLISDISFDRSDDEVDLDMIKPIKSRDRRRSSLAPLIQPVIAAKRARPSVAPTPSANEMLVVTLRSGAIVKSRGPAQSLAPLSVVPRRRSQQSRHVSTHSGAPCPYLTTIWGSTDESGNHSSHTEKDAIGTGTRVEFKGAPDPFSPSSSQGTPPLHQHHFTSKTVIRLECCAVCKSRLRFGKVALKCRPCQLLVHPECRERCPSLCTPGARLRGREGVLADFAPPTPPLVPPIVIQCVNQVEKRGLLETGLYRVPGAEHLVREWKNNLLCARRAVPSLDQVADVNVICGILKDFLRNLREPLVTFHLHSAFLQAAEIPDESARHTALCHVVMKLPPANRDTLAFLMLHLHRVMQSPECRMDQHNLARIFGPTLVGHSTPSPTPLVIMEDTPRQCLVVSCLLALPLKLWKRFVGKEQENLVPSVQEPDIVYEQERLFRPLSSPEVNAVQMSPGSGCLPNKLRDCILTTIPPLNAPRTKKTRKILPLPK
ncbi:rac GTPase-activating protein 1-like isoform X2 [Elgaria multicarinata webbii]|uniref:rac GTPase-activating protein 1-like isoform X2 n=1 Tax=Elgaria multicarinata webbii TaxID=159646 RepID=UPI002FCCF2FB